MDAKSIMQVFADTAYVRTGGSPEELKTAEYLLSRLENWGLKGTLEAFDVDIWRRNSQSMGRPSPARATRTRALPR